MQEESKDDVHTRSTGLRRVGNSFITDCFLTAKQNVARTPSNTELLIHVCLSDYNNETLKKTL